jgi:FAD/FMN-containing dehydrogenase
MINTARKTYKSWGQVNSAEHRVMPVRWISDELRFDSMKETVLPFGKGRSYGDSCLNHGGALLDTNDLNRFIAFNEEKGVLRCEAGVTLEEILQLTVPKGWFLPVSPGTKFVSLGGAIANDVHGKNHHRVGTFGRHVTCFELLRSNGERLICSPKHNAQWYGATIGGLGLTGLILWAEIQLKHISNAFIETETIRFQSLDEFFKISRESAETHEYTVAWVDTLAPRSAVGRGIFIRGNSSQRTHGLPFRRGPLQPLNIPTDAPHVLLNRFTLGLFNVMYYHKRRPARSVDHYDEFFYPLDRLSQWNRLYGKSGFYQYQCVVPEEAAHEVLQWMLRKISRSRAGSFLGVLKQFGDLTSPGMLSFPKRGTTLAVDFPNRGHSTLELMEEFDAAVRSTSGAVYPAKDARMSAESFQTFFPQWKIFSRFVDPKFSSSFWRRVTSSFT